MNNPPSLYPILRNSRSNHLSKRRLHLSYAISAGRSRIRSVSGEEEEEEEGGGLPRIPRSCNKRGDIGNAAFNLLARNPSRARNPPFPAPRLFRNRAVWKPCRPSVMAARRGSWPWVSHTDRRIRNCGMPVNERKKGRTASLKPACTRLFVLAVLAATFVRLFKPLLFILTTACPRSSMSPLNWYPRGSGRDADFPKLRHATRRIFWKILETRVCKIKNIIKHHQTWKLNLIRTK